MSPVKAIVLTLVALALLAASAGAALVYFGVYNVAATDQHTRPVYWLLNLSLKRAAVRRAQEEEFRIRRDRKWLFREPIERLVDRISERFQ